MVVWDFFHQQFQIPSLKPMGHQLQKFIQLHDFWQLVRAKLQPFHVMTSNSSSLSSFVNFSCPKTACENIVSTKANTFQAQLSKRNFHAWPLQIFLPSPGRISFLGGLAVDVNMNLAVNCGYGC